LRRQLYLDRGELLAWSARGLRQVDDRLSIMRLVAAPGRIVAGEILFDGRTFCSYQSEMRAVRGNDIA